MNSWLTIWTVLLIAGVGAFAVMALVVTVGGFFDVRAMFRKIDQDHQQSSGEDDSQA
jgi:hypothetical protein